MNSIKLTEIFESIIGERSGLNLDSYPDLKKVVDTYSRMKKGGQPVINITDFDVLSNFSDPLTSKVVDVMNMQKYSDKVNSESFSIPSSTPQGRIYNFGNNLFISIKSGNTGGYDELFNHAFSDLNMFIKSVFNIKPKSASQPEPKTEPVIEPETSQPEPETNDTLGETKYLRNLAYVNTDDQPFHITNEMINSYANSDTDPVVKKYYEAIWNNDMSLPDDLSTDAGAVYTLYKNLRSDCSGLINSLNKVKHNMGYNSSTKGSNSNNNSYSETEIEYLDFGKLTKSSKIKFSYYLQTKNGSGYYNNVKKLYKAIFLYSPLTHGHRFINIASKNNSITFLKYDNGVEQGRVYPINYTFNNEVEYELKMDIRLIEVVTGSTDANSASFEPCGALDELIDILTELINGETK